tara:strand:- start:6887 stop:8008 length:1122 start_codon:yes stop_codon:yes gene_type:complete
MAKSDISDEQLDSIGMSRERWEQLTSYYAELMDRALDKPETGFLGAFNFMNIYDPNLDLVDDFAAFVKKLSTDPQVKNLFVSDVDRKYTPLGGNPNIGLRETLIKNIGRHLDPKFEASYLKKFGFATDAILGDTDEESKLKAQELDINAPYFQGFDPQGEKVKEEELPEVTDWGNEEMGFGESKGDGTDSDKRQDKPPTGKADLLKKERDKQAALAGTDGPYGYRGGYEQFLKDQQILAPTALGKTEKDGSFRLRTPSEVQARIRQGQFNIQEPKREALRRFRDRFGGFQQERKQFMEDTGEDPLEVEKRTTAGQQQMAAQREGQKREMLDKQFKVQEPDFGESPFLKDLSPTERAEVLRMVKEKEEKAFGKY